VIVGAFVVAAVFTPPDVISQLMMAIPLCLLFELGLLLARFVGQRSARPAPSDQPLRKPLGPDDRVWTPLSTRKWIRRSRISARSRHATASRMPDRPGCPAAGPHCSGRRFCRPGNGESDA
jgi:hypothetical protein